MTLHGVIAMLSASQLADRLARDAEAVCRYYLSAGHRAGNYWIVGDVANSKGKSLYVHLSGRALGGGQMQQPVNMAICSTSFEKPAAWWTSVMSQRRRAVS